MLQEAHFFVCTVPKTLSARIARIPPRGRTRSPPDNRLHPATIADSIRIEKDEHVHMLHKFVSLLTRLVPPGRLQGMCDTIVCSYSCNAKHNDVALLVKLRRG